MLVQFGFSEMVMEVEMLAFGEPNTFWPMEPSHFSP